MRVQVFVIAGVLLAGCTGGSIVWDGTAFGEGGTGGGAAAADLPCDVAQVLSSSCADCHGPTANQGLVRLASRGDLVAASPAYPTSTEAQRALIRMQQATGEMPPAPNPPVGSAGLAAFQRWVAGGMSTGTCGVSPGDGGTLPTTDAGTWDGGLAGLPCDVAAMVAAKCVNCHGPRGPDIRLLSLADFLGPSPTNAALTVAQSAAQRLASAAKPMPPVGSPAASPAEVAAFNAWLGAGTPEGTCGSVDAGLGDGGLWPTTCASGAYWPANSNRESPDMRPGQPCLACHRTDAEADKRYTYSGTVAQAAHQADRCTDAGVSGLTVQILDANRTVVVTMQVSSRSGNFHSEGLTAAVTMPYTARVWRNGVYAEMTTPQTNGDCNSCHSEQGNTRASGRILGP
jgi:mono/diheme cytochrome c family protein